MLSDEVYALLAKDRFARVYEDRVISDKRRPR
jgi:hypothetical protein